MSVHIISYLRPWFCEAFVFDVGPYPNFKLTTHLHLNGLFHNPTQLSLHGPTMSTRIPALLEPYLALPPESSLVLVTSVLGARANWLVLRFLCSFLRHAAADSEEEEDTGVVLVSFLRDGAFWRDGAAKLVSAAAAGRAAC